MSDRILIAVCLVIVAAILVSAAAWILSRQKLLYDKDTKNIETEIDIPFIGKLKSNAPAIAFAFVALVPLYYAYHLAAPDRLAEFGGTIEAPLEFSDMVTVSITSGSWTDVARPSEEREGYKVANIKLKAPDDWPTYNAFAFVPNSGQHRPSIVSVDGNNSFKLTVSP